MARKRQYPYKIVTTVRLNRHAYGPGEEEQFFTASKQWHARKDVDVAEKDTMARLANTGALVENDAYDEAVDAIEEAGGTVGAGGLAAAATQTGPLQALQPEGEQAGGNDATHQPGVETDEAARAAAAAAVADAAGTPEAAPTTGATATTRRGSTRG